MGGGGNTYDYGFRIYNPNLGRFLSVDPLAMSYAWYSPYHFAGNSPIDAIDLDGLEEYKIILYKGPNDVTVAKLTLVNKNGPLKVNYYSANMRPAQGLDDNPSGYNEQFIKTTNSFDNEIEKKEAEWLYEYSSKIADVFFKEPVEKTKENTTKDEEKKKPTSTTFRGKKLKKGSDMNFNLIPYYLPTSPPVSSPSSVGSAYTPGQISSDGKVFLKELSTKLTSISGVKQIDITITVNTGSTPDLSYFNNVSAKNLKKNINQELKKNGLKGIKINIKVETTSSGSAGSTNIKLSKNEKIYNNRYNIILLKAKQS